MHDASPVAFGDGLGVGAQGREPGDGEGPRGGAQGNAHEHSQTTRRLKKIYVTSTPPSG